MDGTDTFTGLKDGAWSVGGEPRPQRSNTGAGGRDRGLGGGSETILAEPEFRGAGTGGSPPDRWDRGGWRRW
ncbi:hypothetical protein [Methanoculleus chikugoensis]|uniref:hypothetical protein n=1 Tax=Methanoculleus chikugoensis TaxID=118126 RepID=UPI0006D10B14|nr:hypothetical protein [Methanoculleus chikugoensis]